MNNNFTDHRNKSYTFWLWFFIAAILWLSIALVYHFSRLDWLGSTDSGWYWRVVDDLGSFDPAIQPLYPLVIRGLISIFPKVRSEVLGQIVSWVCYSLSVPFMFKIFQLLKTKKPHMMTLFWAMFPFVGVTMAVYPRANAMLLLFTVLCFWSYLKGNKVLFIITASLLPLIHRSSLFFLVFLIPIGVFQKKIKWWMALLTSVPTIVYLILGISRHNSVLWWFTSYSGIEPVTSIPLGDGIIGTIILGISGDLADLLKGLIILLFFGLSIYMLVSKIWKKYPFLLATILPVIVLGLVLPAREIWSLVNYSSFFVVPFSLLKWHDDEHLGNKKYQWIYLVLLTLVYLSQWVYAFYEFHYFGLL